MKTKQPIRASQPNETPQEASRKGSFLRYHLKAYRTLFRAMPDYFLSATLRSLFTAVSPLLTIFFSARILTELGGERRPEVLLHWVILTIAVLALTQFLHQLIQQWHSVSQALFPHRYSHLFSDQCANMDYPDIESGDSMRRLSQIEQFTNFMGNGLHKIQGQYVGLIESLTRILGSIVLSISLFTHRVPADRAESIWLNAPIVSVAVVLIFLGLTLLSSHFVTRSWEIWVKEKDRGTFVNRLFTYFGFFAIDPSRALDVRIYDQAPLFIKKMGENDTFLPGGFFHKLSRGKRGFYMWASAAMYKLVHLLVVFFVCIKAWAGAFGIGLVAQYIGAMGELATGMRSALWILGEMKYNVPFLEETFLFLDTPNRMYTGTLTTEKRSDRNFEIEFRDVSFRYPGTEDWALRHVSFRFHIGERLAVVGQNGSGKTTMIKLLCRLYDPDEGEILLNGIDIRKYKYDDYRALFAPVYQDFHLYDLPIGENVATVSKGHPDYDENLIRSCLEKVGFGDRLASLPKGIDTGVGHSLDKDGIKLSGGEAQKIAIARALYPNRTFLILDEPTAALDPITEYEIYTRLNDIVEDRTAVFISHRLSSCRFSDRVLVFDRGMLVQSGTHSELVNDASGKYHALWHAQAQYYTDEERTLLVEPV